MSGFRIRRRIKTAIVTAKLNKKDMSVPKYFVDRPELNTREWGTAVPQVGK